jgi:hypothetical protein
MELHKLKQHILHDLKEKLKEESITEISNSLIDSVTSA